MARPQKLYYSLVSTPGTLCVGKVPYSTNKPKTIIISAVLCSRSVVWWLCGHGVMATEWLLQGCCCGHGMVATAWFDGGCGCCMGGCGCGMVWWWLLQLVVVVAAAWFLVLLRLLFFLLWVFFVFAASV